MRDRVFARLIAPLIMVVAAGFFLLPLFAMLRFALQNIQVIDLRWSNMFEKWSLAPLWSAFSDDQFGRALTLSLKLAVGTGLISLLLLVPTIVWVEFLTILPYVIPAIGMVAGIMVIKPHARWFLDSDLSLIPFYVVLALPFTFRSIDSGLKALDLRTLVEASRSLGFGWIRTIVHVIVPNLRSAILSCLFLTVAVVLGEYTIADVLLKRTFPAFMGEYRGSDPKGGYGLAILSLVVTTLIFMIIGLVSRPKSARRRRAKGAT
jgi:putative spermidine/putrescine transport system permease protein